MTREDQGLIMSGAGDRRQRQQQIAAEIRAQIMNGELVPGQQLANNSELSVRFKVAGTTIQHALNVLKDEGFLIGRKGQGVYVRSRQPFAVDVSNYFEPSRDGYSYTILDVRETEPPADVARALQLSETDRVILRRRLTLHSGDPVDLSASYYPAELARGTRLTDKRKIPGGAPQLLADLGYPQREFVDEVSTRLPTTDELQVLNLPASVPVLQQFRTIYSDERRPVEASVLVKGGHLYLLRYRQQIH